MDTSPPRRIEPDPAPRRQKDTMFESKNDPLLSRAEFLARMGRSLGVTLLIVAFSLLLGGAGYHYFGDSALDRCRAERLDDPHGHGAGRSPAVHGGQAFCDLLRLYSGIAFLTMMAVLLAPVIHRLMHKFHLEESDDEKR